MVATELGRNLPWYASGPANVIAKVFGSTPEDCAEHLFDALWNGSMKTGAHFVDSKGKEINGKVASDEGVQEKIWTHTESIIGKS